MGCPNFTDDVGKSQGIVDKSKKKKWMRNRYASIFDYLKSQRISI